MDDQENAIRRGRRRFLALALGAPLLGGVIGALFVGQVADEGWAAWSAGQPPEWARITGLVLSVVGVLVELGALVWAARRGRLRSNRRSPLWAMSMRKRSRLVKQVRRGEPAPDADLPTLTVVARQMVDGGWWAVLAAGLVVFNLGQALARFTSGVALAVFGLAAALFALTGWQVHRNARRAEEFLRHRASEPTAV
ncbi:MULTISPECIES: hypothetical protein [unclassified Micromonospora]|uniref:hypothetical protein n=1 Tax=unclassified Micromonospora TaxID=2617518 RepID=UPI001C22BA41|nr:MULTISPECIES: hypothetical protein [unclassified Micromonospora]MBU8857398.1 hypothetical protein [Micromonospora sp. WMMB482]MDM4783022.1 hypothetical protein [Micromonospora sp. b486]